MIRYDTTYMSLPENQSHQDPNRDQQPFELPDELTEFLAREKYAMVTEASNQGTVFVVKALGKDNAGVSGPVPMEVHSELHQHVLAPVIRAVVRIHDLLE